MKAKGLEELRGMRGIFVTHEFFPFDDDSKTTVNSHLT